MIAHILLQAGIIAYSLNLGDTMAVNVFVKMDKSD